MAEKIDDTEIEWGTPRGGPSLVDWDKVFDGMVWKMVKGEDYRGQAKNFAHSVYRQAMKRGMRARVKVVDENTVLIQAQKETAVDRVEKAEAVKVDDAPGLPEGGVAPAALEATAGDRVEAEPLEAGADTMLVRGEAVPASDVPVVPTGAPVGENPFKARKAAALAGGGDSLAGPAAELHQS